MKEIEITIFFPALFGFWLKKIILSSRLYESYVRLVCVCSSYKNDHSFKSKHGLNKIYAKYHTKTGETLWNEKHIENIKFHRYMYETA